MNDLIRIKLTRSDSSGLCIALGREIAEIERRLRIPGWITEERLRVAAQTYLEQMQRCLAAVEKARA